MIQSGLPIKNGMNILKTQKDAFVVKKYNKEVGLEHYLQQVIDDKIKVYVPCV